MGFTTEKERFCKNALGWTLSSLREFDPTIKANRRLRLKALSELLFISYLYKRRFRTLPPPLDGFISFGVDIVREMNYSDGIHRRPELIIPYSIIYKSLRGCDAEVGTLKGDIQSMLDIGLPMASEDNPYRIMELRYALEDEGFRNMPPTLLSLYRSTSFHRALDDTPPILSLGLNQLYGLTHLVFYLSGFGFSNRSIPESASLRWLVSAQLGLQTLERNWDAVAELLMCCSFLRYYPSPFYRSAWSSIFRAQKVDGSLTDNFFDVKKHDKMTVPEDRAYYYFEQHYHTTLVAAAAAFLTEERDTEKADPFRPIVTRHRRPECSKELIRAHAWLLKQYSDGSRNLELSSLLYILVGDWTWRLLADHRDAGTVRHLYQKLRDDIVRSIGDSPSALEGCDPALVLLAQNIFRKFDLSVADFELLASESADALKRDPDLVSRDSRLFPVKYLLQSLDFKIEEDGSLPETSQEERMRGMLDHASGASDEGLRMLVSYVSRATSFGSLRFLLEYPGFADETRANLAALSYHNLLHYRLDEGLSLVRAMNYAGMNPSKPFDEAIGYILAQQRDDGSFGFYTDEIEMITKSDERFDASQRIIIPTTVSAMWTIAEAGMKGRSLFSSMRDMVGSNRPNDRRKMMMMKKKLNPHAKT